MFCVTYFACFRVCDKSENNAGEIHVFLFVPVCSPAIPKASPQWARSVTDERAISSHSGIIDRYTVTLLEADKYKLQKELQKTLDRLRVRESELHWTKVALSKIRAEGSPRPGFSSLSPGAAESTASATSTVGSQVDTAARSNRQSMPVPQPEQGAMRPLSPRPRSSADCAVGEPRSPLIQRLGTSVDDLSTNSDSVTKTALRQSEGPLLQGSVSAGGSCVDVKRDRYGAFYPEHFIADFLEYLPTKQKWWDEFKKEGWGGLCYYFVAAFMGQILGSFEMTRVGSLHFSLNHR